MDFKKLTLDEIPALKLGGNAAVTSETGLFYYCHTAARALAAYGEPVITDGQGNKHDWRKEIVARLTARQSADGSWVGEKRWMESNPLVATPLALLALEEAKADLKVHPAG